MSAAVVAAWLRGSLVANAGRVLLTLLCIALGVTMASAVHTIHASALAEIDRAARTLSGSAQLEVRGPRAGFDEAAFFAIASRPEVEVASPVVEIDAPEATRPGVVRVLGLDAFRAMRMQAAFVPGAQAANAGDAAALLDPRSAWLSPAYARRTRLATGADVALRSGTGVVTFRVAGVLAGLQDAGEVVVMDIATAQERFGRLGRLSRIDVRLRPGASVADFERSAARLLPPGVALERASASPDRAADITRAYRVNLDAMALVALATGAFMVFSTLALQAARRRQEFALLRALGATRGGLTVLVVLEGALLGLLGAILGIAMGLAASVAMLARVGADLGAGYFGGGGATLDPDPWGLAGIALVAIGASAFGAWRVARDVARIDVAEALRDRAIDLPGARDHWSRGLAFLASGIPFLWAPPVAGLPLGGYAAIACWLAGMVALVGPASRALLARLGHDGKAIPALAVAQVRQLPGHLAASVAGIVVSASLGVAMAIMVHSFRVSVESWLQGVVRGDLYVSASEAGNTTAFSARDQDRVAAIPGVASVEALRFDRLVVPGEANPVSLIARPIDDALLRAFQAEPATRPARTGDIDVWISEAARDLRGWKAGDTISLPIAGREVPVRVAGVIRDFARTWGAVMIDTVDYRRLTGDVLASELVLHLAPGVEVSRVEAALRATFPDAGLAMEDAAGLRLRSLAIFDRSFAITYALEAIAIAIGLAGVTSSFAALAWSRRREFGVLRFLGLRRRDVLRMLGLEGALVGGLGAILGLATGALVSGVLVHVVNRQSFHWRLDLHVPWIELALVVAGVVVACSLGARLSGMLAVRREAVLAVKEDA